MDFLYREPAYVVSSFVKNVFFERMKMKSLDKNIYRPVTNFAISIMPFLSVDTFQTLNW